MSRPVAGRTHQMQTMQGAKGTGGTLEGLTLKLFKSDVLPNAYTPIADYIEPTFAGYAPVTPVVFGLSVMEAGGAVAVYGAESQFTCTEDGADDIIHGWFAVKGATPTEAALAERFDEPISIARIGDYVRCAPRYIIPQA